MTEEQKKNEFEEYIKSKKEVIKEKVNLMNLPELEGSEMQVSLAEEIRRDILIDLEEQRVYFPYDAVFIFLISQTQAKFWIDNRYKILLYIVRENFSAIKEIMIQHGGYDTTREMIRVFMKRKDDFIDFTGLTKNDNSI